jgi:uncharacterized protein YfaS (alpha-2-macroglobulin family)
MKIWLASWFLSVVRGHSRWILAVVAVLSGVCGTGSAGRFADGATGSVVAPAADPWRRSGLWKEVDRLTGEQKLEAAARQVAAIRDVAMKQGQRSEWAAALLREATLRIALHGYESAVQLLRETPWPTGGLERSALELYYAHALVRYFQTYSWEIQRRETVAGTAPNTLPMDLKQATREQLVAEAQRAYQRVWAGRQGLGPAPVAALAEVIQPNDYPPQVRGTLRDAVTYLAVELLANTALWQPDQSNELFRLDFKALLANEVRGIPALDQATVHPLERAVRALAELEAWHASEGRVEAALEAELERLRRLYDAFERPEQRQAIRGRLAGRLASSRRRTVPWLAMGQAQLAQWLRQEGRLAEAHVAAEAGCALHPGSVGAARCKHILSSLEAPDYQLESMASDGAKRRSVLVTHKNLPRLYFRAYSVNLDERLARSKQGELTLAHDELRALVRTGVPVKSWEVQLPPTPDYERHRTFVAPPLDGKGLYVLAASSRRDFGEQGNRVVGVHLLLTDLAILVRSGTVLGGVKGAARGATAPTGWEVEVVSATSGQPVFGATVRLYHRQWGRPHVQEAEGQTDRHGRVVVTPGHAQSSPHFVVAKKDGDVAVDAGWLWSARAPSTPRESTAALLFTDRSVYRPGQRVRWKGVSYRGRRDLGQLRVAPGVALTVRLYDGNNQEVGHRDVTTNRYGSAAGELEIPAGRLLGDWRLQASVGGAAYLRVEEYKRPTFELGLREPSAPLRLNRPAALVGEAKYYFGLPVTRGQVKWHVTREPVYPFWRSWWGGGGASGSQTVASGRSVLKPDGTFEVGFTPQVDEGAGRDVTYRYQVAAELTDEGGETRTASRTFRLGFVSVEASLQSDAGFLVEAEPGRVTVRRTSLDGVGRAGRGTWRLVRLQQPPKPLMPADLPARTGAPNEPLNTERGAPQRYATTGDRQRARWETSYAVDEQLAGWSDGVEATHGALVHDAKGEATIALPPLEPGAYRLRYTTQDDFGATFTTHQELLVAAKGEAPTPVALPLVLSVQRSSVRVGQRARLLIHSGLQGQPVTVELYRAGVRTERRTVAGGSAALLELPVAQELRGGFGVVVSTVRDHQHLSLSGSVFVPWDNKELALELTTFRDKLRPGSQETWRVAVKSKVPGRPVAAAAAELLAYMYDRSLDVLATHSPPAPLSLFPTRTGVMSAQTPLGSSVSGSWIFDQGFVQITTAPLLTPDRIVELDGYGIGGMGGRGGRGRHLLRMERSADSKAESDEVVEKEDAPSAPPASVVRPLGVSSEGHAAAEPAPRVQANSLVAKPPSGGAATAGAGEPVRANFAETAFWSPQLVTGADGTAAIEFTVPDSVTSWNVWIHALTQDLSSGSLHRESRTVKELMLRPYLPRFFREGDRAELKVVVNNASERELAGELVMTITEPGTSRDLAAAFGLAAPKRRFVVAPGRSTNVTFPVVAPSKLGDAVFEVRGVAGGLSDGERHALPVLPSRMHLVQSRFVALRDVDRRAMTFDDLAKGRDPAQGGDPSLVNESLVVTLEAQLFGTVLSALPYLVEYPYECAEQLMNRFLSTGILTSVFRKLPAVASMAKAVAAQRKTQLDPWDRDAAADPNRTMALEEAPWAAEAKGGRDEAIAGGRLRRVLDPDIARADRDAALAKLAKMQLPNGAFPWFPGGPPSPYITLYLLYGFAKAAEFNVEIPRPLVVNGWRYLGSVFRADLAKQMMGHDCCWEFLTFLNFVASSYPDPSWTAGSLTADERTQILGFSFRHWKQHSPYLKGMLALTLERMGRPKDAERVFASVMDSAKTLPDQGTFWAPEDRSWLWYNDTIESHAFALRTLTELSPADPRKDGLVLWLLLNKKLNQWKSTRATAEVIYALVRTLEKDGSLGVHEAATVHVGGRHEPFTFDPGGRVGKAQLVLRSGEVDALAKPGAATVTVDKSTKGFLFASSTWHFSTEKLPEAERGDFFRVARRYFKREHVGNEYLLTPLAGPGVGVKGGAYVAVGDEIEVQLSLRVKHAAEYVHLRDPRPAGAEPVAQTSGYRWDLGVGRFEEIRDSGANFFFEQLPMGEYTFKYRVRANLAGTFRVGPATVQSMYAPEFNAYSTGQRLVVAAGK